MLLQRAMVAFLTRIVLVLRSALNTRASREAEILVLRHQLMVLNRKSRTRVRLRNIDRLILVWLYRAFPPLLNAITVVKPETVLGWHRRGQNGHAERVIGSIRRECLDHLLVFGEAHLRQILKTYACYYNEVRTHLSLEKDAPNFRRCEKLGQMDHSRARRARG
ncbi:MAG: integrase core domain-containing protein [Candidatus Sulfotelmatobacter sp.]